MHVTKIVFKWFDDEGPTALLYVLGDNRDYHSPYGPAYFGIVDGDITKNEYWLEGVEVQKDPTPSWSELKHKYL